MTESEIDWETQFNRLLDERDSHRERVELEEGERRKVAVLFLDIQGFTKLSQHLDPEEARRIAETALRVFAGIVKQYGGRVDKLLGDGMMALFGSRQATERDIDQALLTGIECIHRLQDVNERLTSRSLPGLNIRIGINYGEVVTGKIAGEHGSETVMGAVVNLASRMESNATLNRILLPLETFRLAIGNYHCSEPKKITVKGFDKSISVVEVWALKKPIGFDQCQLHFVGRIDEINRLQNWLSGPPTAIIVTGTAGIGKSRLVAEVMSASRIPTLVVRPPAAVPIPYGVIAALLRRLLRLEEVRLSLTDLITALKRYDTADIGTVDRFAMLLSIRNPDSQLNKLSGETLFRELVAALRTFFAKLPLARSCWVFEDGQWADEVSYRMLTDAIDALTAPVWRVFILRNIAEVPLPQRIQSLPEIILPPFSPDETRQFISALIPHCDLPPRVYQLWSDRASGSPLVLLELGRLLKAQNHLVQDENGNWKLQGWIEEFALPVSLDGLFRSRFDRLEAKQKHWLKLAAIEGAGFRKEIIEQIGISTNAGNPEWDSLVQSGWIYPMQSSFGRFTTPLAQETAYSFLLKSNREKLHCFAAEAYEQLYPDQLDEFSPVLAHHWSGANQPEKATEAMVLWRRTAMKRYDTSSALTAAQQTEKYVSHHKIHRQLEIKIECMLDEAKLRRMLADHQSAENILSRCVGEFEESVDATLRARVLSELSYLRYDQSRLTEALEQVNAALDLCEQNCPEQLECKLRKAILLNMMGNVKEGLEIAEKCHRDLPADADDATIAKVHLALSFLYKTSGRYEESRNAYIESAEASRRQGDLLNMALALSGLAEYYCERKDFDRSITIYREVVDNFDRIGDKLRGVRARNSLAGVFVRMMNFVEAEKHLYSAIEQATLLNNEMLLQAIQNNLGVFAGMQGKLTEAEERFHASEIICRKINARQSLVSALTNLTEIASLRGCWIDVIHNARELTQMSRESGDSLCLLNANLFHANGLLKSGEAKTALEILLPHLEEPELPHYPLLLSMLALAKTILNSDDAETARKIAFEKKVDDDDTGWLLRYEANLLIRQPNPDDVMPVGPFIAERAEVVKARVTGDKSGLPQAMQIFEKAGAVGFVEECQALL